MRKKVLILSECIPVRRWKKFSAEDIVIGWRLLASGNVKKNFFDDNVKEFLQNGDWKNRKLRQRGRVKL